MNKIYKVIWSKVKNCYVVASELVKSHTKSPKSGIVGIVSMASLESKINMDLSKGFVAGVFPMVNTPVVKSSDFKITVAAIVKNEAENVPQWVQAARSCADEIIVVDTGSTDGTVERFADYGIKCFHYDWNDDFASAKNYMISLCHGDWIVLLDGDEWFREGCDVRKAIAKHHNNPVTKAIIADWICLDKDRNNAVMFSGGAVRAFRNQPDVRYFRKVHENLTIKYENFAFEPEFKMYHTGYSGSVNRSKHERNLRIMRTMFDFDNGKVEFPTDWRYIEDTYAGLGDYPKALWAADKMISYGIQEYSASAWVTKFNVLFAMKIPMEEMMKQFAYCFKTVPSVSGFRFLASIYYARNGRADLALDEYTEGVRMLMGPQDKVAMEHTFWRMYLPEASALMATVCLESGQLESALSALYVSEQYCGKTQWTDGVMVELRCRMAVLSRNPFEKVADKALPLLQFAKRGLVATAMASGIVVGALGHANDVFAASCVLAGAGCASGTNATVTGGSDNIASGCNSSISGGSRNIACGYYSSVSGGYCNTASGDCSSVSGGIYNKAIGDYSFVSGGCLNTANGDYSLVIGGCCNIASGSNSSVIGGYCNTASASFSLVSGGCGNRASGVYSSVSGGRQNKSSEYGSSISGGWGNTASGNYSSVTGGCSNISSGCGSSVSGGSWNTVGVYYSYFDASGNIVFVSPTCSGISADGQKITIGSREYNLTKYYGENSSVSGGASNIATACNSSVSGGASNVAGGCYSSVSGGYCNISCGCDSSVSGGSCNIASGENSSVSGGICNLASACNSSVSGGYCNTASGCNSSVTGGRDNTAKGLNSWIAGGSDGFAYANYSSVIGGGIAGVSGCALTARYSVAIGKSATTTKDYEVAIGSCYAPVKIDGALTVDGAKTITDGTTTKSWTELLSVGSPCFADGVVLAGCSNTASGCYSSVSGGSCNTAGLYYSYVNTSGAIVYVSPSCSAISADGKKITVGGCEYVLTKYTGEGASVIGGYCNIASGCYSSVSGGFRNEASGCYSSVSGGECNTAIGKGSSVSGGYYNTASGIDSSVSGGEYNTASGSASSVSGGAYNTASEYGSSVSGGKCNIASGKYSSVSGGSENTASCYYASVTGGQCNLASGEASSVSGGRDNTASGSRSSISGGYCNSASGEFSSIIGGWGNIASSQASSVTGGRYNTASGFASSVSGGCENTAKGSSSWAAGGCSGYAYANYSSAIGGGIAGNVSCSETALGSVAIGNCATTTQDYEIAIGSACAPVKIDGVLTVDGTKTVTDGTTTKTWADVLSGGSEMTGASSSTDGTVGLVKAPVAGDQNKFLRGDGTWADDNNTTYDSMLDTELSEGTSTVARSISAKTLADYVGTELSTESTARTNADTALGTRIDNAIIAYETADTGLSNRIGSLTADGNYIRSSGINDVSANLLALDTQLKATDISSLKYDGDDHSLVTMGGTNGTVLRNVKSGVVNETSMDAVNGSQLYAVKQDITGFADDIKANATNIDALNSSVTAALSSVSASGVLVDTLDSSKANKSLSNLSDAGKRVLKSYAEDAVATYLAGQGLAIPAAPMAVNTTNSNTLTVTNAGNGSLHVGEGSYVNGTSSIAIGVGNQVNANNSGAFGDPSIINADESYVLGNDDTINTGATGSFVVGNDGVSDAKGGLLFGSNTKATIDAEDGMALGNRSEVSAKNAIALGSGSIADTENTLSIGNSDLKRKIVNVADGDISQNSSEAVTGAQLFLTNEKVQQNTEALVKKADIDGGNINTSDWASKLGIGKVEDGNADLVTGGTVYDAIQSVKGNELVQTNGDAITIGANSTASVIDVSNANGQGRAITGIVTDVNDASSAANVGYVNQVGENIVKATNSAFQRVDNKINKVGANAAAIASLPTPTFDGDEKWAFSAGVGHYRGETAASAGAFYKPQDNVIVRVGGSFGNGDEMVGAGVSVSLNKGDTPTVSKTQLVRTINAQAGQIQAQNERIQMVEQENANMKAMREVDNQRIAELEAMVADLAAKVK